MTDSLWVALHRKGIGLSGKQHGIEEGTQALDRPDGPNPDTTSGILTATCVTLGKSLHLSGPSLRVPDGSASQRPVLWVTLVLTLFLSL